MKLALVYDRINKFGGAEQVLLSLHQLFPKAPLFTAVYNPKKAPWADIFQIKSSFLQKFPLAKTHHELYPWLTPLSFESFNFDKFDVVISVTSAEAKAIITKPSTLHICYCLTPTRYLWSHQDQYLKSPGLGIFSRPAKLGLKLSQNYLKNLDLIVSSRPDTYLSISQTVQNRIKKYYHRHSQIIYPPVTTKKFLKKSSQNSFLSNNLPKNYSLLVSRLTSYKRVDLAIKTFNQLNKNLIIVGSGKELSKLKKLSGPTVSFTGQINDSQLINLYQNCFSLIMPQEEDFGIVSVEAQAAGRPVIAFNQGGATETVISHQTGLFFNQPTVDSLAKAVKQSFSYRWDKNFIKKHAQKFDQSVFKSQFKGFIEKSWPAHQKNFQ